VWLPVLFVAPSSMHPESGDVSVPDPITSLEVIDPTGTRVTKVPQADVHRQLAAALAEILLNRLLSNVPTADPSAMRGQLALLAAAIRRLLPGSSGNGPQDLADRTDPDDGPARTEERLDESRRMRPGPPPRCGRG
jgi:hypothetical protein